MRTEAFRPGGEFEHFRIECKIGQGAFATVWQALDTRLARRVALKVLTAADPELDATQHGRMRQEARALARLSHPHVVTLYNAYETEEHGWVFVMEYVDGGSVYDVLREQPRPDPERTNEILRGIARGLGAAHDAGIVHGDVKPGNVLLDSKGTAKLADFGLAKLIQEQSLVLSGAGMLMGTLPYMAPEVYRSGRRSPASDVWSFGVILYEFLAGRQPFDGTHFEALFHVVQNTEPPPLDPSTPPDLVHLVERCLAKDPFERPPGFEAVLRTLDRRTLTTLPAPVPKAAPLPAAPPTFGRQKEIARLEPLLDRVLAGQGSSLLVTGEAGIGKTTLMHELASRARPRGFVWIETRITPVEGLLRPLFDKLRRHLSLGGLEETRRLESPKQMVWALERRIERLADAGPVGLLVEDAHQARPDEIRLLAELGLRLAPSRVLLAVTYRLHGVSDSTVGEEPRSSYHELTARQEFEHLDLQTLDPESVLSILETAAGGVRVDPIVAHRITSLAQGNPLYAKELLQHLVEQGELIRGERTLEPGPAWGQGRLPQRIQEIVAHRLHGLKEQQRQILDTAAVDGFEFDGDAVAAVLGLQLLQVLRTLQNLYRERGLVLPQPSGFRFAHPMIQEVIRDDTAPELQTAIHRRLAKHLENRGPDAGVDPERIGAHWELGGERDRAVPYLLQAADAAEARQELRHTVELCARAGLDPKSLDRETALAHPETSLNLAVCFADLRREEEAQAVYGALIAAAEQAGDEQLRARAIVKRARTLYAARGVEIIDEEEMRRATTLLPVSGIRAVAHYNLGLVAFARGHLDAALDEFRRADEIFVARGKDAGHSDALDQMGSVERQRANLVEAERLYAEAAQVSYRVGRRINGAVSDVNRALVAFDRGALDGLPAILERSISTLRLEGSLGSAAHATVILSHVLYALGDLSGAKRRVREALEYSDRAHYLTGVIAANMAEAEFATAEGRLDRASRCLAAARGAARKSSKVYTHLFSVGISVRRLCLVGEIEAAASEARDALRLASGGVGSKARRDLLLELAEAVVLGLPVAALDSVRGDDLPGPLARILAATRAFAVPDGSPEALHAGAHELHGNDIGMRRAALRVFGRWLEAEALRREGHVVAAEGEARAALDDARHLGHVGYEAGLLTALADWTGSDSVAAQRDRVRARLRPGLGRQP
ncbi:MAG: serine/threonine-protein kinase [Planctomycetota bacterium]